MSRDPTTDKVLSAAIEIHRDLGPGLLESAYEACLSYELAVRGLSFQRQVALPVVYKECHLECGYRMDFVVEGRVLLEVKAVDAIHPIHEAQLLTYLKLSGLKVGLLLNFNVLLMKHGIKRMVL
jgi:GxxExxY protein